MDEYAGPTPENPLFRPIEYAIAERSSFREAVEWMMRRKDTIYSRIRRVTFSESVPVSQNTLGDGQIVKTGGLRTQHEIISGFGDIRHGNFQAITEQIDAAADSLLPQIMTHMFEMMGRTTTATGNSLNAGGKPFSFDLYFAMLNRVEIRFDAEGNAQLPSLVVSPTQEAHLRSLPPFTAEQQRALDELIEEKRRVFLAGRRYRTLSRSTK